MGTVLKTNADAYSLDLTGLETHPMTSTSIGGPSYINLELLLNKFGTEYAERWTDPRYRVSIKLNAAEMVKVLLQALAEIAAAHPEFVREGASNERRNGNEWMNNLLNAINPARAMYVVDGYCSNCEQPAIADPDPDSATINSWVHVGVSCGPSQGQFRLGGRRR